jgi:hypothetical protein
MTPDFDLKAVLETVGPTASLLFAAWIFLQYLNQRYIESVKRLRELIQQRRDQPKEADGSDRLSDQVAMYRRRCLLMSRATNIGLAGAMCLLATLISGAFITVFDGPSILAAVASFGAMVGLGLVLVATVYVVVENRLMTTALRSELSDLDLDH